MHHGWAAPVGVWELRAAVVSVQQRATAAPVPATAAVTTIALQQQCTARQVGSPRKREQGGGALVAGLNEGCAGCGHYRTPSPHPHPASSTIVVFHARLSSVHLCSHACCANTQRCGRTLQMRSRGALQVAHEVAHRHAHIPVGIVRNRSGRLERRHRHGLQRPPVGVLAHLQPVLGVFVSQSSVWCLVYGVWCMAHGAFGVWCLAAHLPALHISPGYIAHSK